MKKISVVALAVLAPVATTAYVHPPSSLSRTQLESYAKAACVGNSRTSPFPISTDRTASPIILQAESDEKKEAAFVPEDSPKEGEDDTLDAVEKLGRGSAKAKRGKRKGGTTSVAKKTAASLEPEEVFYEGPPAITETIIPTISILTVVGIIPAAAAWARQAWVRYKITTRRVRVTSGIAGKDMAEIVYPDIVELRTVKRLFGDGDMVAFLRDGAKFEMRNIPNFDETIEYILKQVDKEVADAYRLKGDVTNP